MKDFSIREFKKSLATALTAILDYWQQNTLDHTHGGFVGQIDHRNQANPTHSKGIILNTRILWTFARANNFYGDDRFKEECERAFTYLTDHFLDETHGGLFWEVDYEGNPTNKRKQIYAQAFGIYAFAEYYKFSKDTAHQQLALDLYELIEQKAYDTKHGGYFEAFGENWAPIKDVRLSHKEINAPKTSNTHLHIMEAYTTLLEITDDQRVKASLENLLELFQNKIIDQKHHLQLFFTEGWQGLSSEISFGHDIETVWLLIHAAKIAGDRSQQATIQQLGQAMTDAFLSQALDADHGVMNALDSITGHLDTDRHWWPQIEAMVGLLYMWQISSKPLYLQQAWRIWQFTQVSIIDAVHGEWFFRVDALGNPYLEEDKVGPWKCPYHNSRGLIEMLEILADKSDF